jgi:hypothetical protein
LAGLSQRAATALSGGGRTRGGGDAAREVPEARIEAAMQGSKKRATRRSVQRARTRPAVCPFEIVTAEAKSDRGA